MGNSALNLRPDTPFAPTETVGSLLQECRLRHGYDLRLIADDLNIRYPYLLAIEDGRYEDLPGPAYAAGFVRTYADYLGLPSEDVLRRFREEMQRQSGGTTRLEFPSTPGGGGMPAGAFLLVTLILAGCIYGVWFWLSSNNKTLADLIPTISSEVTDWIADLTADAPDQVASTPAPAETTRLSGTNGSDIDRDSGTEMGASSDKPSSQGSSSEASPSEASSSPSSSQGSASQTVTAITPPAKSRGSDPLAALLDTPAATTVPSPEESSPEQTQRQQATQQDDTQDVTPSVSGPAIPLPEPPPPAAFHSTTAEEAVDSSAQVTAGEIDGTDPASTNRADTAAEGLQDSAQPADSALDTATDIPDQTPAPDEITPNDTTDEAKAPEGVATAGSSTDQTASVTALETNSALTESPTAPASSSAPQVAPTAETPNVPTSEAAAEPPPETSQDETGQDETGQDETGQDTATETLTVPAVPEVPAAEDGADARGDSTATTEQTPSAQGDGAGEDTAGEDGTEETEQPKDSAPAYVGQAAPDEVKTATGSARIVFRAKSDAWIQLRKNGKLVIRRLLRRGDVYAVPTDGGYVLNTSNAGGLEVYVDGNRVRDLGPMGARLNGIGLSPGSLK